jgi:hypothetical protein
VFHGEYRSEDHHKRDELRSGGNSGPEQDGRQSQQSAHQACTDVPDPERPAKRGCADEEQGGAAGQGGCGPDWKFAARVADRQFEPGRDRDDAKHDRNGRVEKADDRQGTSPLWIGGEERPLGALVVVTWTTSSGRRGVFDGGSVGDIACRWSRSGGSSSTLKVILSNHLWERAWPLGHMIGWDS